MSKKFNTKIEIKIYGENACLAVFKKRPEDIIQVFLTKEKLKKFSVLIKFCAQSKKAYHLVTRIEIDKMTQATHHEDICLLVKKAPKITLTKYLALKPKKSVLLALQNVSNPHNVGAILRNAAHFGAQGILISDEKIAETAAAMRTSEGGFEFVNVIGAPDFKQSLDLLKKEGHTIFTTSSHAKNTLYELNWPDKVVIVFGEEGEGLSKEIMALGTTLKIPGTDFVESLNVSVATAIILSDFYQKSLVKA